MTRITKNDFLSFGPSYYTNHARNAHSLSVRIDHNALRWILNLREATGNLAVTIAIGSDGKTKHCSRDSKNISCSQQTSSSKKHARNISNAWLTHCRPYNQITLEKEAKIVGHSNSQYQFDRDGLLVRQSPINGPLQKVCSDLTARKTDVLSTISRTRRTITKKTDAVYNATTLLLANYWKWLLHDGQTLQILLRRRCIA